MASAAVTTPSPPGSVHTPDTPRHGFSDPWEPYTPRKSARISQRRASQRTPSPHAAERHNSEKNNNPINTARTSRRTASSFSTPATSPRKKRAPAMDSVHRANATSSAEDFLAIGKSKQSLPVPSASSAMLPTPSKTPSKPHDLKTQANVRSVARNLFPAVPDDESLLGGSRKKSKKYSGLTLDSFTAEEVEDPIEIFTDSRDRVPEKDKASDNPFFAADAAPMPEPEPSRRRSRRHQVSIPGEGKVSVEEAVRREDGIVYVFRGKKFFKKRPEHDEEDEEDEDPVADDDVFADIADSPRLTRSSIKPRLLFPPKGKETATATTEDEEAATDIEDHVMDDGHVEDAGMAVPETPDAVDEKKPGTPSAPRYAPASPPTTQRTTRMTDKLRSEATPMRPARVRSPFDGWRRSKRGTDTHGQKRGGEPIAGQDDASKRQRA